MDIEHDPNIIRLTGDPLQDTSISPAACAERERIALLDRFALAALPEMIRWYHGVEDTTFKLASHAAWTAAEDMLAERAHRMEAK